MRLRQYMGLLLTWRGVLRTGAEAQDSLEGRCGRERNGGDYYGHL